MTMAGDALWQKYGRIFVLGSAETLPASEASEPLVKKEEEVAEVSSVCPVVAL
jgi:hypothetical protein